MNNDINPILSVIVISHEQREMLQRCVDSILSMCMDYPYEIIISDDRSKDGTYELALQYAIDVESGKVQIPNLIRFVATQCNSDECRPAYNSERSGYNRCNAYPLALGKYIAHVDADDFFRDGAVVYNEQIKALESHPECAMAMSKHFYVPDSNHMDEMRVEPLPYDLQTGDIITGEAFVKDYYFYLNQAFMMRRNPNVDPVALYGKKYVDSVITYHHLQYGPIVYVDACDYIYIQYANSVTGNMTQTNNDSDIMWCLGLYIPTLIPHWRKTFLRSRYDSIRNVLRMAKSDYMLQPKNYQALHSLDMWIYECFGHHLTKFDKLRLKVCLWWQRKQKQLNWYGDLGCSIMWKFLK